MNELLRILHSKTPNVRTTEEEAKWVQMSLKEGMTERSVTSQ